MKAVILAGGYGTRLSEETEVKPKPLVEIGGKPIIWHILKHLNHYGIKHFYILCGYKGYLIKEYFYNYAIHNSDIEIDCSNGSVKILKKNKENWKITVIDTGVDTMTGGRLLRVKKYLKKDKNFLFTYGDGLSDVNIKDLFEFHKKHKNIATVTSVLPPGRFGSVLIDKNNKVSKFDEKPRGDGNFINGGYFVLKNDIFNYIKDDKTVWEQEPLKNLTKGNELHAFKHKGFWHAMDTLRDRKNLNKLWETNRAYWKVWK
jgi:glucose-1-phosphate cytidylyltransferase